MKFIQKYRDYKLRKMWGEHLTKEGLDKVLNENSSDYDHRVFRKGEIGSFSLMSMEQLLINI